MYLGILAPRYGLCPEGESYYACDANGFAGCCPRDPCDLTECPRDLIDVGGADLPERSPDDVLSTTMTDSGITHTVPNSDVITVTRHTIVVTGKPSSPPPTSASTSSIDLPTSSPTNIDPGASSASSPAPTASDSSAAGTSSAGLSTGAVIGVAVGGAMLLFLLVVSILVVRRHSKASRQQRLESQRRDSSARDDMVEDKHFPQPVSAHTTGTQGYNDPFAPFGGRADEPDDPYRPPENTFEMDGTSVAPVELPAVSVAHCPKSPGPSPESNEQAPVTGGGHSVDPRANLNHLGSQGDRPAYINHWNQYREVHGG